MKRMLAGLALVVCFGMSSEAVAQSPALSWSSAGTNPASITSTRGYVFDVLSPTGVLVTDLSFYDQGANGLAESHDVGIWNSAGTLLASATVPSGTAAPLDVNSLFRVVSISSVFLPQGTGYRVGGVFLAGSSDLQAFAISGPATPSELQYITGAFINNGVNSLTFPTNNLATGLPGGSFQIAAVPEPTTVALLGLAGVSYAGATWWRRRRQNRLTDLHRKAK